MRLVCLSDTHGLHDKIVVPDGDVIVHAGDVTMGGAVKEFLSFIEWFAELPHVVKIFTGGNHDFCLESIESVWELTRGTGVDCLLGSTLTVFDHNFYGYPWVPNLSRWAFYGTDAALRRHCSLIPHDTDVLITHSPPRGHCDRLVNGREIGCEHLRDRINEICPELVVCGHIHEAYGGSYLGGGSYCANVSVLDENYAVTNDPVVIDLER